MHLAGGFCLIWRIYIHFRYQNSCLDVNQWAILYYPGSKVHGVNIGPIWDRQDPGGPHVGPMNFAIWVYMFLWIIILLPTLYVHHINWLILMTHVIQGNAICIYDCIFLPKKLCQLCIPSSSPFQSVCGLDFRIGTYENNVSQFGIFS